MIPEIAVQVNNRLLIKVSSNTELLTILDIGPPMVTIELPLNMMEEIYKAFDSLKDYKKLEIEFAQQLKIKNKEG